MKIALYPVAAITVVLALCSCQTLDYGYYTGELSDEAVAVAFAEYDRSIVEKDIVTFESLLGPSFHIVDNSMRSFNALSRSEYMMTARGVFRNVESIDAYTRISNIEVLDPGSLLRVTVQEEIGQVLRGRRYQMVSIIEVDVAYEDGWVFFKKMRTIARQDLPSIEIGSMLDRF